MKKIAIIHTGGTFVMESNNDGFLTPGNYAFGYIERTLQPLLSDISITQIPLFNIDSSLFRPSHWIAIAEKIEKIYNDFDAFIIIHGTDTMAYTASVLSFFLKNLDKPVILTGSQLPLKDIRSDAMNNLVTALEVAKKTEIKEVVIAFCNTVFRGNRSKKKNSWDFNAFYSPNFPPLVKLGIDIEENKSIYFSKKDGEFHISTEIDEKVIIIPFFPGLDFSITLPIVKERKVHGIIVEAYGSGNIPSDNPGLLELFQEAADKHIPIVVVSQSPDGYVNLELYAVASQADYYGLISAGDMTREAALVKLMTALGKYTKMDEIKKYMKKNIAGEKEDM